MLQGLYSAASGIISIENRQAVYANNIANASTPGFKRQTPVEEGFYQVFLKEQRKPFQLNHLRGPGGGVHLLETYTDYERGVMSATGNALDIGLIGPGYMVTDTPGGTRLTRNGKLSVNPDGNLATPEGYIIQSLDGGPINVRGGHAEINKDGLVRIDGTIAGTIRIVEFADPHILQHEGHNLYRVSAKALSEAMPGLNTTVASHVLEMSNVKLPYEMINMVAALRAYSANQKVINTFSDTTSSIIQQVGSPG